MLANALRIKQNALTNANKYEQMPTFDDNKQM